MMEMFLGSVETGISEGDINVPKGTEIDLAGVLGWAYFAIGVVAAIIIVYAGIQYMLSAGEPDKLQRAKRTIVYTVVGLIVALSATTIIGFITGAFAGE